MGVTTCLSVSNLTCIFSQCLLTHKRLGRYVHRCTEVSDTYFCKLFSSNFDSIWT